MQAPSSHPWERQSPDWHERTRAGRTPVNPASHSATGVTLTSVNVFGVAERRHRQDCLCHVMAIPGYMTILSAGNPLLRKGGSQTLRQTGLCLLRIPQAALQCNNP